MFARAPPQIEISDPLSLSLSRPRPAGQASLSLSLFVFASVLPIFKIDFSPYLCVSVLGGTQLIYGCHQSVGAFTQLLVYERVNQVRGGNRPGEGAEGKRESVSTV